MNATDERAALLRNILEQPADDTARLVFADWLEEKGDQPGDREHALFVRHQIAEAFHNKNVYYPAFEAVRQEWEAGPGKTDKGPIRVDLCPKTGPAERRAFYKSRLMATQSRLMLEKSAGQWLGDLPTAILPPGYLVAQMEGIGESLRAKIARPEIVVRRDDWRHWIEFRMHRLNTGPLFHFRRGFLSQACYWHFFCEGEEDRLTELFRRHPIESVRGYYAPMEYIPFHGVKPYWRWMMQEYHPSVINLRIYDRLPHCKVVYNRYPDRQSAVADFQWACVALGRELAGLPMLPLPPIPQVFDTTKKAKSRKAPT